MKIIFGLQIFPTRPSDSEYVELIRTSLKRKKWLCIPHALVGLISIGFSIWLFTTIGDYARVMPETQNWASIGFSTGLILGFVAGGSLFSGMAFLSICLKDLLGDDRAAKLLIAHYPTPSNPLI